MKKKKLRYILLSTILLLILDLLTKYLFYDLGLCPEIFVPVLNTGISWSLPVPHRIIYLIALISIIVFSFLLKKKYIPRYVFTLFLAGTLGNLIDRIRLGGVRDFILVFDWFPIFNFADILLNIAIIIWIVEEFILTKQKKPIQ